MTYEYPADYLYIGSKTPYMGPVTIFPPPTIALYMPSITTGVDSIPYAELFPEVTTEWVTITTDRTNWEDDYEEKDTQPDKFPVPTTSIRKRKLMLD